MENNNNMESLGLPRKAKGFLVEAELKLTPDKGIGVFTNQFIPAKTKVGKHYLIYYNEQETHEWFEKLSSDEEKKDWLDHSFGFNGKAAVHDPSIDDGGMVNHSDDPNIVLNKSDECTYTVRDVSGERRGTY